MGSQKTVLCVDDDGDDRYLITETINSLSPELNIVQATNGRDALSKLREGKSGGRLPCLILLDINMPIMNGKEMLELVHSDGDLRHLPIVVFTSSANPADKAYFNSKGIEMVTKPFDYKLMSAVLKPFLQICSD